MLAQTRDLVSSRDRVERQGERFGCADCGEPLPAVAAGHTSDYCPACQRAVDALLAAEAAHYEAQ